ncbi:MAG: diaminopimelate epimerase [Sphingomonas sp.]|uniref:diaminopimelate epimerase n=1 Tax=Sphingomonas sp. TaxID=28214 RepID=UPI0025DC0D5E|nr:diaminopimelate epimerase [Sphingomonas sp.]MBY0284616.1 diaminopimelate epimerase [Sphingomonas sp.]
MRIAFTKCHGSGNDFPLIDARALQLPDASWAGVARALADRTGPVGGDGLLLLTKGDESHAFGMRMFNADGSEAETCLNGLRCVARAGFAALGGTTARVKLKTSSATVAIDPDLAPGVVTIRETAGPADPDVSHWPLAGATLLVDARVPNLPSERLFTAISIPNPHLISFVALVDDAELSAIGAVCEAAPAWLPNRANVSFVEVRDGDLFVRTFERGVGLTDSCGSAMAASTYAACLTGRVKFAKPLTVFNAGGMVRAEAGEDAMVTLSGNATFEWDGSAEVDPLRGLAGDLVIDRWHNDEIAAWAGVIERLTDTAHFA